MWSPSTQSLRARIISPFLAAWLRSLGFTRQMLISAEIAGPQRLAVLRRTLRRFPYWVRGHQYLGWAALACNDVSLAQSSCAAVMKLSHSREATLKSRVVSDPAELELRILRGAIAVRLLAFPRATELLGPIFEQQGETTSTLDKKKRDQWEQLDADLRAVAAEELAAAYAGLGDRVAARRVLRLVPAENLSGSGRAALAGLELSV